MSEPTNAHQVVRIHISTNEQVGARKRLRRVVCPRCASFRTPSLSPRDTLFIVVVSADSCQHLLVHPLTHPLYYHLDEECNPGGAFVWLGCNRSCMALH
uniref:Uncharacterized protein n=1 Tax=Mesocestoides corti TaxID=53468 RepID=A0A5K3G340_MESCO